MNPNFNIAKKFSSDNYKRPKNTIQDKLTPQQIEEKLEDYIEVEKIGSVPLNTHLRYFSITTDKKKKKTSKVFRLGGFLINKSNYEDYVILSNGSNKWSVQTKSSIFYKKMNIQKIKSQYEDEIEELNSKIVKLKKNNKKYRSELKKLQKK